MAFALPQPIPYTGNFQSHDPRRPQTFQRLEMPPMHPTINFTETVYPGGPSVARPQTQPSVPRQQHPRPPRVNEERSPLLEARPQRLMDGRGRGVEFPPLEDCRVARLSECGEEGVGAAVEGIIGLQGSRIFHVIDFDRRSPLFVTREHANCLVRNCCPAACRPEHTEVFITGPTRSMQEPEKYFEMNRGCCGEAVMVKDARGGVIGSVTHQHGCMKLRMSVQDNKGRPIYAVHTDRFGPARWIGKLPIGSCRRVCFEVCDAQTGVPMAEISNEWSGFCREFLTDADDYFLYFGQVDLLGDRILLVATALFIDTLYFSRLLSNLARLLLIAIALFYACVLLDEWLPSKDLWPTEDGMPFKHHIKRIAPILRGTDGSPWERHAHL